jgi:S-adenosyl-L-methionine hydrolase (adenosine-forming)
MPNTIALITDFGTQDWYASVMKSVILSINPAARIIDVTHEIKPQHVPEAGFVLWNAYRWFTTKTVFVVVVDPEVGSDRKIIAVETDKHFIVAPDNGLLDLVLSEAKVEKAVIVENSQYFLDDICNTFHGRDIFAPVAAHITLKEKLKSFGSKIEMGEKKSPFIEVSNKGFYKGHVMYIDSFGNLITNIRAEGKLHGTIKMNDYLIPQLSKTFADVKQGEIVAYVGSSGLIEIAIRNGNAAKQLEADYLTKFSLQIE